MERRTVDLSRISKAGDQFEPEHKANPEKSLLETIIVGLDKPDASLRSMLGSMLGDKNAPSAARIFKGEAVYDARDLYNALEKKTGLDLYAGEKGKDNPFYDDIINFATDMAAYVLISPVGGALSLASKGGKFLLGSAKAGTKTGAALKAAFGRAGVGAVAGALTGDDAQESAKNAVIGMLALSAGGHALNKAGTAVGKIGSEILDKHVKGKFPAVFEGAGLAYSDAVKIARDSKQKLKYVGRQMLHMDTKLGLHDLDPKLSKQLSSYLDSKNSQQAMYRNNLESSIYSDQLGLEKAMSPEVYGEGSKLYQFNRTDGNFGARVVLSTEDGARVAHVAPSGGTTFHRVSGEKDISQLRKLSKKLNAAEVTDFNSREAIMHGAKNSAGKSSLKKINSSQLNELTSHSNTFMGKLVREELATHPNQELIGLVNAHVKRNRLAISDFNREMAARGIKEHVMPIDFHTYEVIDPSALHMKTGKDQYKGIKEGFVKRSSEASIRDGGLSYQERLSRESEIFYKNYLTSVEKEAHRIVSGVSGSKRLGVNADRLDSFLDKWDGLTGFLKQQQLTAGHSWIKNNFPDNTLKAWMVGGAKNAWNATKAQTKAFFRMKSDVLTRDLLKITDPSNANSKGLLYETNAVNAALDSGALTEGFFSEAFKASAGKPMLLSRVGKDQTAKILLDAASEGPIKKLYKGYQDVLRSTVGRSGELIEGAARVTTFEHTSNALLRDDAALKELGVIGSSKEINAGLESMGYMDYVRVNPSIKRVYNKAAKIVNATFIDYGNVSAFEQATVKRVVPYWTFFSRDTPYWLKKMGEDPKKLSKVFNVIKAFGDTPTSRERAGIPDYLLERGARVGEGNKTITAPNISLLDAINTVDFRSTALGRLHPAINAMLSMLTGKDGLGRNIYPSDNRSGKVAVPSAGLIIPDVTGATFEGRSGQKYTDSDTFALMAMLRGNLLPIPFLDTIAKTISKTKQGEPVSTQLINLISPVTSTAYDRKRHNKTRNYRMKQVRFDKNNKTQIKNQRRRSKLK